LPVLAPALVVWALLSNARHEHSDALCVGLILVFVSGMSALVVPFLNAFWLFRRGQTLGLAYVELRFVEVPPGRLLLLRTLAFVGPPLFGALVGLLASSFSDNDAEVFGFVFLGVTVGLYVLDWLFCLGPSRLTLSERLTGANVVLRQSERASRSVVLVNALLAIEAVVIVLLPAVESDERHFASVVTALGLLGLAPACKRLAIYRRKW
jgi:hypothetical protein